MRALAMRMSGSSLRSAWSGLGRAPGPERLWYSGALRRRIEVFKARTRPAGATARKDHLEAGEERPTAMDLAGLKKAFLTPARSRSARPNVATIAAPVGRSS